LALAALLFELLARRLLLLTVVSCVCEKAEIFDKIQK
jgi:hypothetical protein